MRFQWKYLPLFLSGFFFDGTVDHIIFAIRRTSAPYGLKLGVSGNLLMALFDLIIATILLIFFIKKFRK